MVRALVDPPWRDTDAGYGKPKPPAPPPPRASRDQLIASDATFTTVQVLEIVGREASKLTRSLEIRDLAVELRTLRRLQVHVGRARSLPDARKRLEGLLAEYEQRIRDAKGREAQSLDGGRMSSNTITLDGAREEITDALVSIDGRSIRYVALADVREILDRVDPEGWISVEDRLPEERHHVIVWSQGCECSFICYLEEGGWFVAGCGFQNRLNPTVTHWRPAPKGPKS